MLTDRQTRALKEHIPPPSTLFDFKFIFFKYSMCILTKSIYFKQLAAIIFYWFFPVVKQVKMIPKLKFGSILHRESQNIGIFTKSSADLNLTLILFWD